ncbi:sulfatase family protein [Pontiella sulfatireligans]|uniref:Choline-sulfatase n=1 Tax=Pontiella sulfatireligans TaxID=2750658 RepID=A0A6C2UFU9_9BACT|nr:sulfatase [Pontiella sulfatireligans]SPS74243.1 sulfatase S1_8 [Kiritimatiellales bacterium]VGO18753.1 Choline-sulfatase [Pontiella sulfatireligans]
MNLRLIFTACVVVQTVMTTAFAAVEARPNILFCIADDASMVSFGAYGGTVVETPAFDRLAEEGALFRNAYNCNPKCSPARACLVTGRYTWQLEEACNHNSAFPDKFKWYPHLLKDAGFYVGFTGKGWAPGEYSGEDNPAGKAYNDNLLTPPHKGISDKDYAANFEVFLDQKPADTPFCFWLGTHEPHRGYAKGTLWKKEGMKLEDAIVPPFFPDNEMIRSDLLDYAAEVKWFDRHLGLAIQALEERGLLENTLIIATSDHGMPFPRVKSQMYEEAFHIPMVAYWKGVIQPGRVINDFVGFPDVAPTFMTVAGMEPHEQMTGKSFLDLLRSTQSGWIDPTRDHVLLGRERTDKTRPNDVGYPVRAIRTKEFLYVHNIKPERWPCGNPEMGLKDTDNSPTKSYLTDLMPGDEEYPYYELSFGLRREEELYQIQDDPHCMSNLAANPEYAALKAKLRKQMEAELTAQKDPRMFGQGDVFDNYPRGKNRSKQKKK